MQKKRWMFGIYRFFIYLCGRYEGCLNFLFRLRLYPWNLKRVMPAQGNVLILSAGSPPYLIINDFKDLF